MKIEFIASVAVITPTPAESRRLYIDALGLPLKQLDGEYFASEEVGGCKHFGVWPLEQAAQACFGTPQWPEDRAIPQTNVEFEAQDPDPVAAGGEELAAAGYQPLHEPRTEPWGQTVARVQARDGAIIGISYAPWFHDEGS